MSKEKQKMEQPVRPQAENRTQGAQTPNLSPSYPGELPHNTKKESLGPNTKR